MTSTVVALDEKPSSSRIRPLSARRPRCSISRTWSGIGAPASPLTTLANRHSGPTSGTGMRPPRRIACSAVIAPLAEHVDRLVEPALGGGDERRGALDVLDDGERRVGEHAERHDRHAQQAPERARDVRAEHAAEAHRGDGHADAPADVARPSLDVGERPTELARRGDGGRLVGACRRATRAARTPRCRCARRSTRAPGTRRPRRGSRSPPRGERLGRLRVGPAERLPDREVDDDVRVEAVDEGRGCGRGRAATRGGTRRAGAGGAADRCRSRAACPTHGSAFEVHGDARAEVAAHPAHEHPPPATARPDGP